MTIWSVFQNPVTFVVDKKAPQNPQNLNLMKIDTHTVGSELMKEALIDIIICMALICTLLR